MKKYYPSFVVGFGAGILNIVPVLKSFGCCLLLPLAAYGAIYLDRKSNNLLTEKIEIKKALLLGLVTGITAAFVTTFTDALITFITHSNDMVANYSDLIKILDDFPVEESAKNDVISFLSSTIKQIKEYGFSFFYTLSLLVSNLISDSIFGIIGGVIGAQVFNSRLKENN